ncbi:MAG: radical SAM protein, partial [Deltaproteobacteria bacterium]|nr:radical SAM protein [Deltaproteobacteria bacterium]
TGKHDYTEGFYSLIINGEEDRLVLPLDARKWQEKFPLYKARLVFAPGVGHDMFISRNSHFVIDVILRAIADVADNHSEGLPGLEAAEPEVRGFLRASPFSVKHLAQCPGARRMTDPNFEPGLYPASEPVFANIEITTQCNFKCRFCARTRMGKDALDMDKTVFRRILELLPHAYRVTLVGLGEPLMHPEICDFIKIASSLNRRVGLVTNASVLDSSLSKELISTGLESIAFSLDSVNQDNAALVRKGTYTDRVLENIRNFIKIADATRPMAKAVFTALSVENILYFNDLVNVISTLGVDVMMLTDLNFQENVKKTIWKNADDKIISSIRNTIKQAFSKRLPVLSVHGLEEFGLRSRYREFLLLPPNQLYHRSEKRKFCLSPWQTAPVDVNGNITVCDCQPENVVGNILTEPFNEIWLGKKMTDYRRRMLSDNPPEACRICPRF